MESFSRRGDFGWRGKLSARTRFASNRATAADAALDAAILNARAPQHECAHTVFTDAIKRNRTEQLGANSSATPRQSTRHTMPSRFHPNSLKTNDGCTC